jgi:hypothetical protein
MNCKSYLQQNARKLDIYLYEYLFEGADSGLLLKEIATYQNDDGGFGNALDADLRLPHSSVLATTIALQYLSQIDAGSSQPLVCAAIRYFKDTYDTARNGWLNIPPAADKYPRAPWWDYESTKQSLEWGNPSAEVLGYLLKYDSNTDVKLLQILTERALRRLQEIEHPEPHEIKCYIRLHERADSGLQKLLYKLLAKQIKRVVKTNPIEWQGYVPAPLTFVTSPNSPFADLFDESLLLENIQFIHKQVVDGNHWDPTWRWGQFEAEWAKARLEWSGKLTVENLVLLKSFGVKL